MMISVLCMHMRLLAIPNLLSPHSLRLPPGERRLDFKKEKKRKKAMRGCATKEMQFHMI